MTKNLIKIPETNDDLLFSENDMNIGPFVDLLTDFGFKKVLGQDESKKHLICFLNLLIFANSNEKIQTVDFLPPELLGDYEAERKVIFDIRCIVISPSSFMMGRKVIEFFVNFQIMLKFCHNSFLNFF